MDIDRLLQRKLLEQMKEAYPNPAHLFEFGSAPEQEMIANLKYLEGHGLCESGLRSGVNHYWSYGEQRITVRGIDFLADDGGLSAILGVVTVKLHADTIRRLLESKVEHSTLPTEEKLSLKQQLAKLPAAVLQMVSEKLIEAGLNQMPDALHWLQTAITSAG